MPWNTLKLQSKTLKSGQTGQNGSVIGNCAKTSLQAKGSRLMPKPNTNFELTPEDMELIETALLAVQKVEPPLRAEPRKVQDLLGRLHNQKVFFRPKKTYVGG